MISGLVPFVPQLIFKKMKFLIVLGMFSCMVFQAFSQVVTILDKETGEPLEYTLLTSEQPKAFATTNSRGQADLSPFKGAERIEIRDAGYKMLSLSYAEMEEEGFILELVPSIISLDAIVISATRWSQKKRDIPAKITTISPREVALQNPQTAADLLAISGEVFVQKSQLGGGSPMIRGFATNRLLISVDGVRMNTAIFRSGNLQNVISLDPFAVEKTEVFFGPGSVIYGSDAIGGVMSFRTLTPQFTLNEKPFISGKAISRYSSASNEKTAHFDINVGWKKWAILSSFSHFDFGDLRMGRNNGPDEYLRPFYVQRQDSTDVVVENDDPLVQRPTGYSQTNFMQKLRFQPNNRWDFSYGFHYSTSTDVPRYDRHIRLKNGLPRSGEWYYGPQTWMMNKLDISHSAAAGPFDQMTIRLAHQYFEESRIDRDFNKSDRHIRVEKVNALSANLDLTKVLPGKAHTFYYGVEAVYNDVNSTGQDENILTGTVLPGPARYPQSNWSSFAAYLTYHYRLSEKLLFQGGGRYNRFLLNAEFDTDFYPFPFSEAKINSGALTGNLGVVYDPLEKLSVSANVSTGFRSPNVDDVGKVFDSEPGSVVIPNPELQAEYVYNAEIDIAKVFGESVKLDVTGFYTVLRNALVRRDFQLNGQDSIWYDGEFSQVQAIQNAAVAQIYGFQASIEVKLPSGFGFESRFNYQRGDEELDDGSRSPSRHAAPWFGVSHLTWSAQKLKMDFYAQYSGSVPYSRLAEEGRGSPHLFATDENGDPWSPGWYTLNLKIMYQFMDQLSISAGIENLTDQRYRPYSSGIVAPGRNFIISAKASF
jgi:hemoglobin/transferrin/lactoferrin receptor protein